MGRSISQATGDAATGSAFFHDASARNYRVFVRDGALVQRRWQVDSAGHETNIVEKRAGYAVGSGNHARTYLFRGAENQWFEMPVSWYAEGGGVWAMSPGYERRDQEDFRRRVPEDCLFCHAAYPLRGTDALLEPIDCQRCHGSGAAHVAAASSGKPVTAIRAAIVNPKRLSRDRQLEVCLQCHLETTSSPLPYTLRRVDRGVFSYRPGEPLADFALYFDHAPGSGHDDKFEVVEAAYRLRQSACFRRSSTMTCTTCHSPHAKTTAFDQACRSCHASARHTAAIPAGTSCAECHMPKRRAEDAVHVVMTDHRIQRRRPTSALSAKAPAADAARLYRGEVVRYYPPGAWTRPFDDLYLAAAQVEHNSNTPRGVARLETLLRAHPKAPPAFFAWLGKGYAQLERHDAARTAFGEALQRDPEHQLAWRGLAQVLTGRGRFADAAALMEQFIWRQPTQANAVTFSNLGHAYLRVGDLGNAQRALIESARRNPELPETHNLLGLVARAQKDMARAEAHFREAIRHQPDLAPAHNNLAEMLAGLGRPEEARYHFQQAISADPAFAAAHHSYGLFLVLQKALPAARLRLEEAARLAPDDTAIRDDLAEVIKALAGPPPR